MFYLSQCEAWVDSVKSLQALLAQRRRWNNGSFFALNAVLDNRHKVEESGHPCSSRLAFYVSMWLSMFSRGLSFASVGIYLFIYFLMIQQVLVSRIEDPALAGFVLYVLVGGMLCIVLGTVLKAVALPRLNNVASLFTYSQFLGLFGLAGYAASVANLIQFFRMVDLRNRSSGSL